MHKMRAMPNGQLISTDEARQILNYAKASSVARLVAQGELTPAAKAPGLRGAFLFRRSDVEALAAKRAAA